MDLFEPQWRMEGNLNMERFRLKSTTTAVRYELGAPKGTAVVIPAGSEVSSTDPIDTRLRLDRSPFIAVKWSGVLVQMFRLDLMERGERILSADE